jgi:hypothetical protein
VTRRDAHQQYYPYLTQATRPALETAYRTLWTVMERLDVIKTLFENEDILYGRLRILGEPLLGALEEARAYEMSKRNVVMGAGTKITPNPRIKVRVILEQVRKVPLNMPPDWELQQAVCYSPPPLPPPPPAPAPSAMQPQGSGYQHSYPQQQQQPQQSRPPSPPPRNSPSPAPQQRGQQPQQQQLLPTKTKRKRGRSV